METEELGSSVEERTPALPPAHGQNLLQPGVTNLVKGGTQNGKEKQLRPTALIIQVFHFLCSDTLTSGALLIDPIWDKSISLIDPEWESNQEYGLPLKEGSAVFLFLERGDLVAINLWK